MPNLFIAFNEQRGLEHSEFLTPRAAAGKVRLSVEFLSSAETPEKTEGFYPEPSGGRPIRPQRDGTVTSPIVIIDEEAALLHDMVEFLRKEALPSPVIGHRVSREAAALIARERPLLLICSLQMPRVGGVDLITLARKRWSNLPMVVLAGGAGRDPGEYARVSENTVQLQKPFRLGTLCECIAELSSGPLRDVLAPLPCPVPIDTEKLAAGPEHVDELPSINLRGDQGALPAPAQEPSNVTLAAGLDLSLSSETPLPSPLSYKYLGRSGEYQKIDEILEVLEDEIEIVEYKDGHLGPANDHIGHEGELEMALTANNIKENLTKLEAIEGFIGAALADSDSGMCLGALGGGGIINLEVAAAANTEVVRSKRKAIKALSLRDEIEDFLISLGKQYHLIRPVRSRPNLFFYVVLDRQRANLAMARFSLADAERELPM